MTDREKLALEWAQKIMSNEGNGGMWESTRAAAEFILANVQLTMADVEWDDKEHLLAGASDNRGTEVVMLGMQRDDEFSALELFVWDVEAGGICPDWPSYYTPNGKRYEIREITEPEHPATLATLEDYENAPVGTIVADDWDCPHTKIDDGRWSFRNNDHVPLDTMAVTESRVLRWGWGE